MTCPAIPTWVVRFEDGVIPVCSPHLGETLERAVKSGRANFQILFVTDPAGVKCHHGMAGISVELKAVASLGKEEKIIEESPRLNSKASVEVTS